MTTFVFSQHKEWQKLDDQKKIEGITLENLDKNNFSIFELDIEALKLKLVNAPLRHLSNGQSNVIVDFPDVSGKLQQYRIVETSIFSSEDNAIQHQNIKTYLGSRLDNTGARIRFSVTPLGLNAMISEPDKDMFFIQPGHQNF